MNYIPKSRAGKGFLLTFVSSISYYSYDRVQTNIVRDKLEKEMHSWGSLPIKPTDPSDKVKIYIAPSFYALNWFNSYIKPFLYIGGLDYELVQKELDQNFKDVLDTLEEYKNNVTITTEKITSRTWIEYFRGMQAPTRNVFKVKNELKGIVGVGPETFEGVSSGYEDGLKVLNEEFGELRLKYPILYSLPGKEQTGWRGFPKRIFWAFHQRWILQEVGDGLNGLFKKIHDL